ncbi:unnamed protein product [Sphenostylis stenocarpa]|uniref:Uncharacterized protein n=1 Tax=Sphenostylis stenocarpa TaxID=92480 RepID=A0AA86VQ02_9FABA|nr:unnamed protein product [Sphenostylis stenocarpa]
MLMKKSICIALVTIMLVLSSQLCSVQSRVLRSKVLPEVADDCAELKGSGSSLWRLFAVSSNNSITRHLHLKNDQGGSGFRHVRTTMAKPCGYADFESSLTHPDRTESLWEKLVILAANINAPWHFWNSKAFLILGNEDMQWRLMFKEAFIFRLPQFKSYHLWWWNLPEMVNLINRHRSPFRFLRRGSSQQGFEPFMREK